MSQPYIAEIMMCSFAFAPQNWALCNGQQIAINSNQAMFALLGTTYGGDGTTTFALPNLQGRTPIHVGGGNILGQQGGVETAQLAVTPTRIPSTDAGALSYVGYNPTTIHIPTRTPFLTLNFVIALFGVFPSRN